MHKLIRENSLKHLHFNRYTKGLKEIIKSINCLNISLEQTYKVKFTGNYAYYELIFPSYCPFFQLVCMLVLLLPLHILKPTLTFLD